jgi:hypothetical protein
MVGVILSSKKIEGELCIDFGDITPSELPLANRKIIEHQSSELSRFCSKIFVTTFSKDSSLSRYEKVKTIIVEKDLAITELIKSIIKKFNNESILFLYGDTFIRFPKLLKPTSTMFYVKDIDFSYPNWFFLEKNKIMCGAFIINKQAIKKLDYNNISSLSDLFYFIVNSGKLLKINKKDWYDFGHYHTYYISKKSFLETRDFNSISVSSKGFVEKSSKDISKILYEYNWLKKAHKIFPSIVPVVKDLDIKNTSTCSYKIVYENTPSLSDIFVHGNHDLKTKLKILVKLIKTINLIQNFYAHREPKENFIYKKLIEREEKIIKTATLFSLEKEVKSIISKNKNYFKNKTFHETIMHGDFCFSNILYNRRYDKITLIDPRGYLSTNAGFSFFGPYVYDYFKLAHSFIGGYDYIISGGNPIDSTKEETHNKLSFFCGETGLSKELIIYGLVNLFLTMIPLHRDSPERQQKFLINAINFQKLV